MMEIKFGTDGWRAIVADTFTFSNVRRVAQAIALYVNHHFPGPAGVVVGYDYRFLGERFAQTVAEVLMGNQRTVYLLPQGTPTPVTAYMIRERKAAGAVMLTASHNPAEYNGIKFIPEYAGPALPAITDEIERYLENVLSAGTGTGNMLEANPVQRIPFAEGKEKGLLQEIQPKAAYFAHLQNLIQGDKIRKVPLKVVVDPMYGCGIGYLAEFLETMGCQVETLHNHRDPLYGNTVPEPMGKWLAPLQQQVLASQADLGLAMDGDADRFGVVDRQGNYVTANQVLYLLLNYLIQHRTYRGPVARTVATTHMLDRIAQKHGLAIEETAVGFKYIGQALLERGALLGGEESGGMSINGHIPEKDGILANALMVEMLAVTGKDLAQLQQEVTAEYGQLWSQRWDIHTSVLEKERVVKLLSTFAPAQIAGISVAERILHDGTKLVLTSGDWALIRPSGTEPLLRLYVEAGSQLRLSQMQEEIIQSLGLSGGEIVKC